MSSLTILKTRIAQLNPDLPCFDRFIYCRAIDIAIDISSKLYDQFTLDSEPVAIAIRNLPT